MMPADPNYDDSRTMTAPPSPPPTLMAILLMPRSPFQLCVPAICGLFFAAWIAYYAVISGRRFFFQIRAIGLESRGGERRRSHCLLWLCWKLLLTGHKAFSQPANDAIP